MISRIIWPMAQKFVGGKNVFEALEKASVLKNLGYRVIFSSSDENVNFEDEVNILKIQNELTVLMRNLDQTDKIAIKLSQFGLTKAKSISENWASMSHLLAVLDMAREKRIRVAFDAEFIADRYFYTQFLESLWKAGYGNIERVVQAYGPDSNWNNFIKECIETPMPVRVCMGAYKSDKHALSFKNHYNQIAYQFDYAVDAFLLNGIEVEIATGNAERINAWLRKKIYFGEIHHWPLIHFSMLLGIRPDIAHSLKKAGCAPHLYLLFGDAWFPYFWRRILENPQNLLLPFQKQHPY